MPKLHVTMTAILLDLFFFLLFLDGPIVFVADRYPVNHAHYSLLLLLRTLLSSKNQRQINYMFLFPKLMYNFSIGSWHHVR
jgi:hypothetical protein